MQVGRRLLSTVLPSTVPHHWLLPRKHQCHRLMRTALYQKTQLGPGGRFLPGLLSTDHLPWMQPHRMRMTMRMRRNCSRKGMSSLGVLALFAGRQVSALMWSYSKCGLESQSVLQVGKMPRIMKQCSVLIRQIMWSLEGLLGHESLLFWTDLTALRS